MSQNSSVLSKADVPPQKLAETVPGVYPLFRERWSPRSFSAREISDAELEAVLDAARWAASSNNEQPWRFIVARRTDQEAFQRLLGILVPTNQKWARKAAVLIIMAAKKTFTHNGAQNYHALHDAGAACAHILLQAAASGFQGHGMAGFDHDRATKELNFPDDFMPAAAIALGYLAPPEELEMDEKYREMERACRQRKPLSELAFSGTWGRALTLSREA